ncbi:MAG: UbiA family prenyltransferase [Bacteroidota bacterium]
MPARHPVAAFLLFSGWHVGGVAVALLAGTGAWLGLPVSPALLGVAACATILIYQWEQPARWAPEAAYSHPERTAWRQQYRTFRQVLSVGLLAGLGLLLPSLAVRTLLLCVPLGLLALLYLAPVLPGRRRLKTWPLAKPMVVTMAWALGAVLPVVTEAGVPLTSAAWGLVLLRAALVWPNALLADWGDREGDRRAGLQTLAAQSSQPRVRRLALLPLGMAVGVLVTGLLKGWLPPVATGEVGGYLLLGAVVLGPWPRSPWFYTLLLDGLVAVPGVLAVAGRAMG